MSVLWLLSGGSLPDRVLLEGRSDVTWQKKRRPSEVDSMSRGLQWTMICTCGIIVNILCGLYPLELWPEFHTNHWQSFWIHCAKLSTWGRAQSSRAGHHWIAHNALPSSRMWFAPIQHCHRDRDSWELSTWAWATVTDGQTYCQNPSLSHKSSSTSHALHHWRKSTGRYLIEVGIVFQTS